MGEATTDRAAFDETVVDIALFGCKERELLRHFRTVFGVTPWTAATAATFQPLVKRSTISNRLRGAMQAFL